MQTNPDLIVTDGDAAAAAVKPMAGSIPVVFVSGDPVGLSLIPSLSRPGGNLTGFAIVSTELNVKRLRLRAPLQRDAAALLGIPGDPEVTRSRAAYGAAG